LTSSRKTCRTLFILGLLLTLLPAAKAQFQDNLNVTVQQTNIDATELLESLEKEYNLNFRFRPEWLTNLRLSADIFNQPLSFTLNEIFGPQGFSFIYRDPSYIILVKNGSVSVSIKAEDLEESEMITLGEVDREATEAILTGQILGGEDELQVRGVVVLGVESGVSVTSNANGRYRITLPVGPQTLQFKSIEYDDLELSLNLNSSSELNINLYQNVRQLNEVVVTAEAPDENITRTVTGVEKLDIEEIKKQPALMGQTDVIKSLTTIAGVTTTGEASAGFNVRGSGTGGNLILLDNGLIFNPSHLFGVFSSFTTDAISGVELYKGTIPSKFGGRVASVLDVTLKSGDKEKVTGNGSVGFVASNIAVEIPVVKQESSLLLSARAAYPNYLLNAFDNRDISESEAFFGDFSLKYDHRLNKNNIITASVYGSNNRFNIRDEIGYDYNNLLGTVHWNHVFSPDLNSRINYSVSQYSYTFDEKISDDLAYDLFSVIENQKLDIDFSYSGIDNHLIDFGANSIYHSLKPGNFSPDATARLVNLQDLRQEFGVESGLHVGDEITINPKLSAYVGLRFSHFVGWDDVLETTTYTGLEPRFSLNYQVGKTGAIKAGYNKMRQFIHLISNTAAITPIDIWKLSNEVLAPTISDQFTLGYFRNFADNDIEASVEGYYKDIQNLIDYKNGANIFGNPSINDELIQGEGEAYGVEFNLEKKTGKTTGRLSYTWARTFITIADEDGRESINRGNAYPTNFDQPHNLTAQWNIQTSRRFRISGNFIYATGRPITLPQSFYQIEGATIANYSIRNGQRIPDYHRLDLSFHLASSLRKEKNVEANFTLTLFNVYGRRNAYSVFFRTNENGRQVDAYRLTVLGQIIPALSYTFKF